MFFTGLCKYLLIIVTNKILYVLYVLFEKSLLRMIINKRTEQTCKDNYIILHTSFKADWLLGAYDRQIFLIT